MSVWIGMTGGMDKHWGEKELPRVGHQLASCSLLIYYVMKLLFVLAISKGKSVCPGYSNHNSVFPSPHIINYTRIEPVCFGANSNITVLTSLTVKPSITPKISQSYYR